MSLNVFGLKSRLENKDFKKNLGKYDVLSFCETLADDADFDFFNSEFDNLGFIVFIQNRKKLANKKSGGILVAVRKELGSYVKRLNCAEDFVVVLDIDKGLFKFEKNIIFITAYIPPPASKYSSVDLFNSMSNIILNYDTDDYFHLLTGDLNARTKNGSDLVTFDREILELLHLDEDTSVRLDIIKNFDLLGLPIERFSMDLKEDHYGKTLLELCKNHMLCIFNGRTGADRNIGKVTTKGNTLIDYVIGSPYLLSKVKIFRVNSFDPCFLIIIALWNGK